MKKSKMGGVAVIEREINPLIYAAERVEIVDSVGMNEAVTLLSEMNKIIDRAKKEKERVTKPLNEALKAERSRWKPLEDAYGGAVEGLRGKMGAYQTEQDRVRKEDEDRIAARIREGRGGLSMEKAIEKIGELDEVENTVSTDSGMVKFRDVKKLVIFDVGLVPREYMVPDEGKIKEALVGGGVVGGCRIDTEKVPVNFR